MSALLELWLAVCLQTPAGAAEWDRWAALMTEASRLATRGEFRAALPLAEEAVEHARRTGGDESRLAESLDGHGFLLRQTGDYRRAEGALLASLAISKRRPAQQQRTAITLDHLAMVYQETQGHTAEVEALRRKALDMAVASFGPEAPEVGMLLSRLAGSLMARGKFNEATTKLDRALQITDERQFPALEADIYLHLGAVAHHKQQYAAALEAFHRAGQLYGQVAGATGAGRVPELTGTAAVYLKTKRAPEADKALVEAEQIAAQVWGPEHRIVAEILLLREKSLKKLGRREEAKRVEERAKQILSAHKAANNWVNLHVDASFLSR